MNTYTHDGCTFNSILRAKSMVRLNCTINSILIARLECDCCHGYRQRRLEEALLFSGQFKDAMQALLDWLYKMETHLAEDQPVHGDLDTVNSLIEEHRVGDMSTG